MKTIIFIPPNGVLKKQDFLFDRLSNYFKNKLDYKTIIICLKNNYEETLVSTNYSEVILSDTIENMVLSIKSIDAEYIINRGWMHAYAFSAQLLKEIKNMNIIVKDWNFSTKEKYKFLFNDDSDFEAIEYIFKNSNKVLSHFTVEQAKIWAKSYNVDVNKFIYFPEMCHEDNMIDKFIKIDKEINLVYAGRISPTSLPQEYFPGKSHLRSIKTLTAKKINIDFVLPPMIYRDVFENKELYLDFIYEHRFNNRFNIIKGEILNPEILHKYHFGFFELEASGINDMLYRYGVVSKFAFYLEANLPIIVNSKFISIAKIVKEEKIGLVFSNKDLENLNEIINSKKDEYSIYINNIKKYRKEFSYTKKLKEIFDAL